MESSVTAALRKVDLFGGLHENHLERIASVGRLISYDSGTHIFSEGDEGNAFFIVLVGEVRISRILSGIGEENLAVLPAGHHFGEMSLVTDSPRSASAIANSQCQVFSLGRTEFQDLLFVDRDIAYVVLWRFVQTLSQRLSASNDKMTLLASASMF